jgi:hypothetical protein
MRILKFQTDPLPKYLVMHGLKSWLSASPLRLAQVNLMMRASKMKMGLKLEIPEEMHSR